MMRIIQTPATIGLLLLGLLTVPLKAQDVSPAMQLNLGQGISVIGVGVTTVKPSVVEVRATLSADSELANDARVKERDARQRVSEALDARSPGIVVESAGISINPMIDPSVQALQARVAQQVVIQNGVMMQVPQNTVDTSRRVSVSEQLRLVLKDADQLETPRLVETVLKLIDIGREAGLQIGQPNFSTANGVTTIQASSLQAPGPLITCRAADTSAVRDAAYKAAIEDARQKASRLAELSGVKIGKVIGIQELDNGVAQSVTIVANQEGSLSSNSLGEMPVRVRLNVQFEIVK